MTLHDMITDIEAHVAKFDATVHADVSAWLAELKAKLATLKGPAAPVVSGSSLSTKDGEIAKGSATPTHNK
jgi:hypothetical protein